MLAYQRVKSGMNAPVDLALSLHVECDELDGGARMSSKGKPAGCS